jgi:diguanylate cyclase (GGDEF)-like protein
LPHAAEHLAELWDGTYRKQHEVECAIGPGAKIFALMESSVLRGHEHDWRRVLVAIVDITGRKAAQARAAYLGSHDALTGLGNRAGLEQMRSEICEASAWPVTMLVADMNGLKDANDLAGHSAGDALIVRAAALLQQCIAAPAAAFRTGGDEFVVILPQTDESAAQMLVTQLNRAIDADNALHRAHVLGLSLGHATCRAPGDWDAACQLADQRMYAAKRLHYRAMGKDRRRSGARGPVPQLLAPTHPIFQDSH